MATCRRHLDASVGRISMGALVSSSSAKAQDGRSFPRHSTSHSSVCSEATTTTILASSEVTPSFTLPDAALGLGPPPGDSCDNLRLCPFSAAPLSSATSSEVQILSRRIVICLEGRRCLK
ncbi:hypothetical protein CVT26_006472 [Gymnopilus dilepis]|uniref:Uncharacterized protein n=1 Tax=Gymnopilus dilepis TaxID=231916 RepID=A0A409YTX5_9AGAR|nr:hypothetical protein CVT26_006472 [Gymnopilus dilepis]